MIPLSVARLSSCGSRTGLVIFYLCSLLTTPRSAWAPSRDVITALTGPALLLNGSPPPCLSLKRFERPKTYRSIEPALARRERTTTHSSARHHFHSSPATHAFKVIHSLQHARRTHRDTFLDTLGYSGLACLIILKKYSRKHPRPSSRRLRDFSLAFLKP